MKKITSTECDDQTGCSDAKRAETKPVCQLCSSWKDVHYVGPVEDVENGPSRRDVPEPGEITLVCTECEQQMNDACNAEDACDFNELITNLTNAGLPVIVFDDDTE